ncbi:MAG: putative N-acetylmuramoyl-L-alanine amidase [Paenibacillaceae bacterium]|jgi:N-acetylmuramoyl-L-alanine amidase|nr:putative N-acetylmuramoyl-L-alanine amidase [Paenibacillaceae bacterium]
MGFGSCVKLGLAILSVGLLSGIVPGPTFAAKEGNKQVICIDPGHQLRGNNQLEPVAPGSSTKKAKVSSGTRGVKTGKPEYMLTLEASLLLKEKLEAYGYTVVMTRDSHDVDVSNAERAQIGNEAQADLSVRIHADGASSPKVQGVSVLYPQWTEANHSIYEASKSAAQMILEEVTDATGAVSRGIVPRSDLTGFNWSTVPSVLVEMGFMTNPAEDQKLSDPDYLNRLMEGMALGINKSLSVPADEPEMEDSFSISLPDITQLYEYTNGRLSRTRLALSSQTVQVTATRGGWGKVETWVGEMWLHIGDMKR